VVGTGATVELETWRLSLSFGRLTRPDLVILTAGAAAEGAVGVEDEVVKEVYRAADEGAAAAGAAGRETTAGLAEGARAAAVACPASGLSRSVKRKSSQRGSTGYVAGATATI
jgi:hypothetical protein